MNERKRKGMTWGQRIKRAREKERRRREGKKRRKERDDTGRCAQEGKELARSNTSNQHPLYNTGRHLVCLLQSCTALSSVPL
jgi:hypothetical protein